MSSRDGLSAPRSRAPSSLSSGTPLPATADRTSIRRHGMVVASLGPDDVFGERALIDHLPRNVTAVAVPEPPLAVVERKDFLSLVHESPTSALGIWVRWPAGCATTTNESECSEGKRGPNCG